MYIIPIISGKGGVGKSTVAVNLSIALASLGKDVALLDADFYGPSIPTMLGKDGELQTDHKGNIIPYNKFGIKYLSLGFFLPNEDDAVIWRGPMFNKALNQLFNEVNWGSPDYLIVDMPPGTGDAQLSLVQLAKVLGAVIVTTPQEVALSDVRKAINMLEKVDVPLLGIIENMAGFKDSSGEIHHIFGKGGGEKIAKLTNAPIFASIPINPLIVQGGDTAKPAVTSDSEVAKLFQQVAEQFVQAVDKQAKEGVNLEIVNN